MECGNKFLEAKHIPSWIQFANQHVKDLNPTGAKYKPNQEINQKVSLYQGDSTTLEIDAVVNAANFSLMGGGGIDGAIHRGAGRFLRKETKNLPGLQTGQAVLTKGYKLPAKYIIHTVGPRNEDAESLKQCYTNCLELVLKHNIKTVGFCCISAGVFGFPLKAATNIALDTVRNFLEKNYKMVLKLSLVSNTNLGR